MGQLIIDPITFVAHLDSHLPTTNWGDYSQPSISYTVGVTKGAAISCRTVMQADISELAGLTIYNTSKLEVNVWSVLSGGAAACVFSRITRTDVVEAETTWNVYKTGSNWTTPGGDSANPYVNFTGPSATGWFTITGDELAAFLQDTLARDGIVRMLGQTVEATPTKGFGFYSDDDTGDPSRKPKLTIDHSGAAAGRRRIFVC